jgi:hypothetical protein
MHSKLAIAFYCAASLMPLTAGAQRPAAADPAAAAATPKYESAFPAYRPYEEQTPRSWRELNDDVAKVGGHAGIFGGAGHAGHGSPKPAGQPVGQESAVRGQPPVRKAPEALTDKPHH